MLTLINFEVKNNPYKAGIEIVSSAATSSTGGVTQIVIARSAAGGSFETVYKKDIYSLHDLSFSLLDITTRAQQVYTYSIELYSNTNLLESGSVQNVKCWFDGLFIGNFDRYYVAGLNCQTDITRNTQGEIVTTMAGKYPYFVRNADTNYATGTSSGVFLPFNVETNRFIPDVDSSYAREVLDFLTDGTDKLLRTHDGKIYNVVVGNTPKLPYNGYTGMTAVEFQWTEIDEVPAIGMVVE